jgi:hypothetical protein
MTTKAIEAILGIISDPKVPMSRRIEACEGLLAYEAPDDVVGSAKAFLESVFEDRDHHYDDRLKALKLTRQFEARRIREPTVRAADTHAARERGRRLEMARRRVALIEAGVPLLPGWAADLLDPEYVPEPVALGDDLAASVKAGRLAAAALAKKRKKADGKAKA